MTENVENLILEHLRAMRTWNAMADRQFAEIKHRLAHIETAVARNGRDLAVNYAEQVQDRHDLDLIKDRLDRIEKRLGLTDA